MEKIRKPFQGVINIIRFNWHYYVIAILSVIVLLVLSVYVAEPVTTILYIISVLILVTTIISLLASMYVYDLSGLYELKWITGSDKDQMVVNINAGFDETSSLIKEKFPAASLVVLDFYDPAKHTEVSIKRARKACPHFPGTQTITTDHLPLADATADKILVIFAAHEIRNEEERIMFFQELHRVIKDDGIIYITEHLRDLPNFLVYTIGFFHFFSKRSWKRVFSKSGFIICQEIKCTPFVSTFILSKYGTVN